MPFVADSKIQQIAEASAQKAIEFARDQLGVVLDFSDESIRHLEGSMNRLHSSFQTDRPSEEQVANIAQMLGSYLGEVFRRNHSATWGMVTLSGDRFPGMSRPDGLEFWPWGRLRNRIINGPEDNIWNYYHYLMTPKEGRPQPGSSGPANPNPSSPVEERNRKKSFWQRLRGA